MSSLYLDAFVSFEKGIKEATATKSAVALGHFQEAARLFKLAQDSEGQAMAAIAICSVSDQDKLDLSGLGLTEIPDQLFELRSLKELKLNNNRLTAIPSGISRLGQLVLLSLANNKLGQLPNEIGRLQNLKRLELEGNLLSSLPASTRELSNLEWLNLGFNKLKLFPAEVLALYNLRLLGLANNSISSLPGEVSSLGNLILIDLSLNGLANVPRAVCSIKGLIALYLHGNRLQTLPATLSGLKNLTVLTLHNNILQDLPDSLAYLPLVEMTLHGNEALQLPPEILGPEWTKSAKDNPAAPPQDILQFYFSRRTGTQRSLNEVKVLVVGEGEVGKTSLIRQLRGQNYDPKESKTHGIERHKLAMECGALGEVQLNIWDFGGQDIMHATHQFFMTHRSVYLLVLDSRQNERQTRIDYWLRLIASYGGNSPVIVVCNKGDQQLMQLNWTALHRDYPQIKAFAKEVSCYHDANQDLRKGLDELKREIAHSIEHHVPEVNRQLPSTWFSVKYELEADGRDYLSLEEFHKLAESKGISDDRDRRVLLTLLHQLGSVLHFSEHSIFDRDRTNNSAPAHVEELNVLDPGWVTVAIYKLLNDHELIRAGGIMDRGSMRRSLEGLPGGLTRFPKNKDDFIIAMMRRFEIAFAFDGDKETWLLPDLLHEDELETGEWSGALAFRYTYRVLPASVIGRLMVRLHVFIDRNRMWRTGALFKQGKCEALVRSDPESAQMEILIRGGLPQERRSLLGLIRGTLTAIHQSFSNQLGEKEQVPIPGHPSIFINYEKLLLLEAHGEDFDTEVVDGELLKIPVSEVLNGVAELAQRRADLVNMKHKNWSDVIVSGNLFANIAREMNTNNSTINIKGNVSNSQIGQALSNCANSIEKQPESPKKVLLTQIAQEVNKILDGLPAEKKEEAGQVADNLEQLVKQATSDRPNKAWYHVSTTGLLEAATWVKDYSGNIADTIGKLGNAIGISS
jgi:small GTP-binding protein